MLLGHLDAAVSEQHRNALHGHAGLKQGYSECVSKAVGMTVENFRFLKHGL
jgi:hypothetical protein